MDAIFCVVLSFLVIRWWWKSNSADKNESRRNTVKNRWAKKDKRITDEELITVILPTLHNDGK